MAVIVCCVMTVILSSEISYGTESNRAMSSHVCVVISIICLSTRLFKVPRCDFLFMSCAKQYALGNASSCILINRLLFFSLESTNTSLCHVPSCDWCCHDCCFAALCGWTHVASLWCNIMRHPIMSSQIILWCTVWYRWWKKYWDLLLQ